MFGRINLGDKSGESHPTVKMAVKVANGHATPCGTAVTDAARRMLNSELLRSPKVGELRDAKHYCTLCLEDAKKGLWREAVADLLEAQQLIGSIVGMRR